MPPCYTFNKMCIPDSGLDRCPGSASTSSCAETVTWFWLLAGVVGVGLLVANMGKS
jgi:hypothetical protein